MTSRAAIDDTEHSLAAIDDQPEWLSALNAAELQDFVRQLQQAIRSDA